MSEAVISIRPSDLSPRGRVWNAVASMAGRFKAEAVAKMLPDIAHRTVQRHVAELAEAGTVERVQRGQFARIDGAPWPRPDVRHLTEGASRCTRYVERELSVQIPATEDGLWSLMLYLDREGWPISARLLVEGGQGLIPREDIDVFLATLERGRYIERVYKATGEALWRVVRRQRETPLLSWSGRPVARASRTANMWRAMKMCGYFTARDLSVAASTPELRVSEEDAASYAADLAGAGYLIAREQSGANVYRMKSSMNTGPAAPRVLRARFVWDPNVCRIMGAATHVEEVRR